MGEEFENIPYILTHRIFVFVLAFCRELDGQLRRHLCSAVGWSNTLIMCVVQPAAQRAFTTLHLVSSAAKLAVPVAPASLRAVQRIGSMCFSWTMRLSNL